MRAGLCRVSGLEEFYEQNPQLETTPGPGTRLLKGLGGIDRSGAFDCFSRAVERSDGVSLMRRLAMNRVRPRRSSSSSKVVWWLSYESGRGLPQSKSFASTRRFRIAR